MKTTRHYFISDDLDDLEALEEQLESAGIDAPQIHVLTHDHAGVAAHHHLHEVGSLLETDVIRHWEIGAIVGFIGAALVLAGGYFSGMTSAVTGWTPFIFLAIVVLGFCTWEGGFIGFQKTNAHYEQFKRALDDGRHVFFVDVLPEQESALTEKLRDHPTLDVAAEEAGPGSWAFTGRKHLLKFTDRNLLTTSQLHNPNR